MLGWVKLFRAIHYSEWHAAQKASAVRSITKHSKAIWKCRHSTHLPNGNPFKTLCFSLSLSLPSHSCTSSFSDSSKNTVTEQINNPTYRVSGAGENVGLNIRIEIEKESYVAYSKSFYGAKILIHDAENFPQTSVTTTTIGQPGYDLTIAVLPSVIVSEPGIRSLSQKQRNCLFVDEVWNPFRDKEPL